MSVGLYAARAGLVGVLVGLAISSVSYKADKGRYARLKDLEKNPAVIEYVRLKNSRQDDFNNFQGVSGLIGGVSGAAIGAAYARRKKIS